MPQANDEVTLKTKVYRELRRAIITGSRPPGEKLNVRGFADQYGTSITPIREALQMLYQEGLVTIIPHSGYLVTQLTLKQLRDLLALREILELAAVELAAERITNEQLSELEHIPAGYTGDDDESYDRYTDENRRFHYLVARASGNQELADTIGRLHDRLARFMVLRRAGQTMQDSHKLIITALRGRDRAAARQALGVELTESHQIILDRVIQDEGERWRLGAAGK